MDNQTQSGLVGGRWMKSVIFQHPSVVSLLTGRGKKLETAREVEVEGVSAPEIKPGFNCSTCAAYGEMRDRKRGQKQCHYLNYQSPSLFVQAGFACWVFSRSPGVSQGGVRWVEIVVFVVLRVWLLWEQDFSQQGSFSTGHTSDLETLITHTNVKFLFINSLIFDDNTIIKSC